MGKKGKDKKKGKGAEKTAAKTEKKLSAKLKKELAVIGEDDIESILAQIEKEEKRRDKVVEAIVAPPSRRATFSLVPHPDKEELILFGGEFFNGQKMCLYNDLFFYNIQRNEWNVVKAPNGPPPRCGHQMVALSAQKGQLWVFGGEYASPSQSQFYHYKDLWVYHLAQKKWEKITAPGGPSARSGHRMVCVKKNLIVFGGFHDNLRDYKYFNDVYVFNLETYKWTKLEPTGTAPAPRSGCNMVTLSDGRVAVFGGYSKTRIKKDVDKGQIHTDMFILTPEKNDTTGTKWKWVSQKLGGIRMQPRCSMPITVAPNNKAYAFGGVFDTEDEEENIAGTFYNDLHCLDLEKLVWRTVTVSKKNEGNKTKRRKEKCDGDDEKVESDSEISEMETNQLATTISDDGVFTVKIGPAPSTSSHQNLGSSSSNVTFVPSPRMNCGLAVKHGVLYLYGGMIEDGDRQFTLNDFYSLDLHKLEEWKTIIDDSEYTKEWIDSGSESDENLEDEESESDGSDDESMETD